jgi:glutamate racemase
VGVIATESTVRSSAYDRALKRLRPELQVTSRACPLFVPLVEEGWHDDPVTVEIARRYLEPLLAEKIDTLVLGCTHYPLLVPLFQRLTGGEVALIDSAEAVAVEVADELGRLDLLANEDRPEHHFCVTDAGERFARIARMVLGDGEVSLELVDVA